MSESQTIKECLQKRARRKKCEWINVVFRNTVESSLLAGVALSKVDAMRRFLKKYGHRLSGCAHLSELIPAILHREKETLKEELKSVKEVSVIFDEKACLDEALAIVGGFFHEDLYKPTQLLIRLEVLAKALKEEEVASRLISCLAVDYNFGPRVVIGGMHDGPSVNGAAVRNVRLFYARLFDVVCFSHTIDNVGSHFEFQVLDSFVRFWIGLFSHSYNVKLARREDRTVNPYLQRNQLVE